MLGGLVEEVPRLAEGEGLHVAQPLPRLAEALLEVGVGDLLEDCLPRLGEVALPLAQLVPRVVVVRVQFVPGGQGGLKLDVSGYIRIYLVISGFIWFIWLYLIILGFNWLYQGYIWVSSNILLW